MRNPHWGSIKWPHANRVCAQLWRDAFQRGAVHQTQISKFFSIRIISTLSLLYLVDFSKDICWKLTSVIWPCIYVCSYHLSIIIFHFTNYQSRKVFLNFIVMWCFRSLMDAPSSFVLPCHCPPVRKFQISSEIFQQHFRLIWSHIYTRFVIVNGRTPRKHRNIEIKDKTRSATDNHSVVQSPTIPLPLSAQGRGKDAKRCTDIPRYFLC